LSELTISVDGILVAASTVQVGRAFVNLGIE
jgi:hypothetical protein